MKYLQPNPYTCVPATFAYLAHKQCGLDFYQLLEKLVSECDLQFNLKKNGMDFIELQTVVKNLGFVTLVSTVFPENKPYLMGVKCLPKIEFKDSELITKSISDGSLKLTDTQFLYPEGHAVAVFENGDTCSIFDSFFGEERVLSFDELAVCVEDKPEFLQIIDWPDKKN